MSPMIDESICLESFSELYVPQEGETQKEPAGLITYTDKIQNFWKPRDQNLEELWKSKQESSLDYG